MKKGLETGEQKGTEYVELRGEETHLTLLSYSDGRVDNLISKIRTGLACRVLHNGAWGFTCGRSDDASTLVAEACSLAQAAAHHRKDKITLAEITPAQEEIVRMGVKEQQMYWMAIKALQEAQTRIETLEAQNTAILARLDALEAG